MSALGIHSLPLTPLLVSDSLSRFLTSDQVAFSLPSLSLVAFGPANDLRNSSRP